MGRSKRAKKGSNWWAIVLVIVCVLVVGGTFYMLHDIKGKVKKVNNISSNIVENTVENVIEENQTDIQNITNETNTVENTTTNEIKNTIDTKNNQVQNTTKEKKVSNSPAIPAVTDDKQKAIELVKKEWGEDDTVSFSFDYINEKGEYVVAVKDKASATVKNYFKVNLQNGTVELD